MAFDVDFSDRAAKELKKLDKQIQIRITSKLNEYAKNENLSEARFKNGNWRYRIGDWRVIFELNEKHLSVLKVGHKSEVYD